MARWHRPLSPGKCWLQGRVLNCLELNVSVCVCLVARAREHVFIWALLFVWFFNFLPPGPCSADPISDDSDDAVTAPRFSQLPDFFWLFQRFFNRKIKLNVATRFPQNKTIIRNTKSRGLEVWFTPTPAVEEPTKPGRFGFGLSFGFVIVRGGISLKVVSTHTRTESNFKFDL